MATFQELVDEAFADLLKKHGAPIDQKDPLKKSVKGIPPKSEKFYPRKRGMETTKAQRAR